MKIQQLQEDKADAIKMDVPLFIRMLEYAREDAKTDRDLHDLAALVRLVLFLAIWIVCLSVIIYNDLQHMKNYPSLKISYEIVWNSKK